MTLILEVYLWQHVLSMHSDCSQMGSLASQDRLMLYDSGHRFEHVDLLLVLLQSLPFASPTLQHRALQVKMNKSLCLLHPFLLVTIVWWLLLYKGVVLKCIQYSGKDTGLPSKWMLL